MKYRKVRPNSYIWLKLLYAFFFIVLFQSILFGLMGENIWWLIVGIMVILGVLYIKIARKKLIKARDISRLIHKHIRENELYQTETKGRKNREVYTFYPKVYWRIDKSLNTLFIRFRLSGNKINLRGLEQGLSDRLEKIPLNVYEERGYIEYLFELETEKRLIINNKEEIQGTYGETQVTLAPSFIWDYRKVAGFMLIGATGSGKTTLSRFLITHLINRGVRIIYVDVKRDLEMERFCSGNLMITYAYETEAIAKVISEVAEELQNRTQDISNMKIDEDFDFGFNPVFLICDEIILMKLIFPKKLYDETIKRINEIIVGGRSKNIFCGLISQSALAEYFGNSGIRGNIGLKIALGHLTSTEYSMIFGQEFSDIKNLRYNEIGSGLIMRSGEDSRPREFVAPYIKNGVLD